MTCTHKTFKDHITGYDKEKRKLWKCSMCGKVDIWDDYNWSYEGQVECPKCCTPVVHRVACCYKCRKAMEEDPTRWVT